MAEQHTVRVVVEGDTSSYTSAVARASSESSKFTEAVGKSESAIAKTAASSSKAEVAIGKLAVSKGKATGAALAMSKGIDTAKGGALDLAKAATAAAASFGPWGIAIAVAGNALIGLVEGQLSASKATRQHTEDMKKQRAEAALKKQEEDTANRLTVMRHRQGVAEAKADKARQDAVFLKIESSRSALEGIENALAEHGRGKDTIALQREENRIRVENLRLQGDMAGAAQLQRDFELDTLKLLGEQGAARASAASVHPSGAGKVGISSLGFAGFSGNVAGESQSRAFEAELAAANGMQRAGSDTRDAGAAQAVADERLRAIEIERATTGESIELIEREKNARLELIDVQIQASTLGAERAQLANDQEQVNHEAALARIDAQHEAALARIDAQKASEEKLMARRVALAQMAVGLANSGAQLANMVAKASGASAKKQEAIANRVAGVQAMAIGALEVVQAVAAAASFNVPQAVLHGAAAVVAFAQGGMLLALGGGGGGGAASGGGSAVGGGSLGAAPSGGSSPTPGSDSAIPGSPGPQSPSSGGGSSGGGKTNVINISGNFYGTPKRDFIRQITEGQEAEAPNRRRVGGD